MNECPDVSGGVQPIVLQAHYALPGMSCCTAYIDLADPDLLQIVGKGSEVTW